MSRAGEELENRVSGERVVFLRTAAETGGELLEMDDFWTRADHQTPEHVHPEMEERWEVMAGHCRFLIAGSERLAGPGETVTAPAGAPHTARKVGAEPVHLRIQMRPALRWEEFVARLFALSNEALDGAQADPAALGRLLEEFPRELSFGASAQPDGQGSTRSIRA